MGTELNCRTPSWCRKELLWCGKNCHTFGDQKCSSFFFFWPLSFLNSLFKYCSMKINMLSYLSDKVGSLSPGFCVKVKETHRKERHRWKKD